MPRVKYRFSDSEFSCEGVLPRTYVTKKDLLDFLQQDQADLKDVRAIRYRVGENDSFALLTEDSFIKVDDVLHLLLLKGARLSVFCLPR